jgi:hypothetical protein
MRAAPCHVTALLYLSFYFFFGLSLSIYIWLGQLPPLPPYPWRLPSYLILGGEHCLLFCHPSLIRLLPNQTLRLAMDCACGCLARMEPMLETCVFSEGLVLNQRQRHSALCSLLYSPVIGFRAPFVHQMTDDDVNDSWVCISRIVFSCVVCS